MISHHYAFKSNSNGVIWSNKYGTYNTRLFWIKGCVRMYSIRAYTEKMKSIGGGNTMYGGRIRIKQRIDQRGAAHRAYIHINIYKYTHTLHARK